MAREEITCEKVLSAKARSQIRKKRLSGAYADRGDETEPPYMAPSEDPDEYSRVRLEHCHIDIADTLTLKWCSICNDFGSKLILCAGCRVTVCMSTMGTGIGCVHWDGSVNDEDFVYICPYCAFAQRVSTTVCLNRPASIPT